MSKFNLIHGYGMVFIEFAAIGIRKRDRKSVLLFQTADSDSDSDEKHLKSLDSRKAWILSRLFAILKQ